MRRFQLGLGTLLFLGLVLGGQVAYGDSPCDVPGSILINGDFSDPYSPSSNGEVAEGWWPFVEVGSPRFERDPVESPSAPSQKIWTDGVGFVAGIYQRVEGVTPGKAYLAHVEWAPFSCHKDGEHLRGPFIGRKIGIDPTGGTDPTSAAIAWSPEVWEEWEIRREVPEMRVSAVAQGDAITVFIRADDHQTHGKDEVWFDIACLIVDPVQPEPTSTSVPPTNTPTATETPVPPTSVPTATPMPPTDTPLPTLTLTATMIPPTATPTSTTAPTASPSPTKVVVAMEEEPEPTVTIQRDSETTPTNESESSELWSYLFLGVAVAGFGGAGILGILAFWIWRR